VRNPHASTPHSTLKKNFQNGILLLTTWKALPYNPLRYGRWVAVEECACDERGSKHLTLSEEATHGSSEEESSGKEGRFEGEEEGSGQEEGHCKEEEVVTPLHKQLSD